MAQTRIRTTRQTLYQWEELSDEAKEQARECIVYSFDPTFWDDFRDTINEDWTEWFIPEKLTPFGFTADKKSLEWESDAWGNFPHVSFTGTVDLAAWMKALKLAGKYRALYDAARGESRFEVEVTRSYDTKTEHAIYVIGGDITYVSHTDEAQLRRGDYGHYECASSPILEQAEAVEKLLADWLDERQDELRDTLEKEYTYRHSLEYVADMAEANAWEFDREGNFPPRVLDDVEEQVA